MKLLCVSVLWSGALLTPATDANPSSHPYIPFRTSPFNQTHLDHTFEWETDPTRSRPVDYDPGHATPKDQCPLAFSLGISRRHHQSESKGLGIVEPPIIYPILPSQGPGRQVLYTTQYEHLDLLTPMPTQTPEIKEGLTQHVEFPLLFEASAFLTSPILRDVNGDGIVDAILTDYDGGIYALGLQVQEGRRYFHKAQVPRLFVRRDWMEGMVNETLGIDPTGKDDQQEEQQKEENKKEGNETSEEVPTDRSRSRESVHDPYHTYFEYVYGSEKEEVLRGVTANVLGQDHRDAHSYQERKRRKIQHNSPKGEEEQPENEEVDSNHRRLQEVVENNEQQEQLEEIQQADPDADLQDEPKQIVEPNAGQDKPLDAQQDPPSDQDEPKQAVELNGAGQDKPPDEQQDLPNDQNELEREMEEARGASIYYGDDGYEYAGDFGGDDIVEKGDFSGDVDDDLYGGGNHGRRHGQDDDYPRYDDEYPRYDDYYGRYGSESEDYYDNKHYVRVPPHVLCTPVLAEFPKMYSQSGETEHLLFVAVSYYLDEDEYEGFFSHQRFETRDRGDETEVQRGMYVANALMVYQFGDSPRWGRQEHLDLSGDHSAPVNTTLVGSIPLQQDNSKMGAFALSSPTVADIDGDGNMDVLLGTSMGFVYNLDARNLYKRDNWPVQFQHAIESRILVEDVRGDTNLEIFVADVGGNVVCLDHQAKKLWHRDLARSATGGEVGSEVLASSPMVLGDVNGDGMLDIVITLKIRAPGRPDSQYLYALSADSGADLPNFPIRLMNNAAPPLRAKQDPEGEEFVHKKLPAPLLVDLHADQNFLNSYLHRNGTSWERPKRAEPKKPPQGGYKYGLHIVQPFESNVVIVEAGSGCIQTVVIGDEILAMVQADDVHGTGKLDLVISTSSGKIITLESPAPFHPLNVWNNGEIRGSTNTFAHGYSASQGIFVHEVSRQYRDIFGVYIPVTFEIFDNRPNIQNEPGKRVYAVDIRQGTSRPLFRKIYNSTGVYTARLYIPYGPGYYSLNAVLKTTHGLVYEDTFHLGYNISYMEGFGVLLWFPLLVSSIVIFLCTSKKSHWDDDDYDGDGLDNRQGILGGPLPA